MQGVLHQRISELFAPRLLADNHPANHNGRKIVVAFQNPRIRHQLVIAPAEDVPVLADQVIAVDILIRAGLFNHKDFAAQLEQGVE